MKGGALSLDARGTKALINFAFDHACPGIGVGFGFEDFEQGLDSPYGRSAILAAFYQ